MAGSHIQHKRVEPISKRDTAAFVTRNGTCGLETIALDVYPPSEQTELRAKRIAFGLTLREAATALGMRVVEVSEVERGARVFVDTETYAAAIAVLHSAAQSGTKQAPRGGEGG